MAATKAPPPALVPCADARTIPEEPPPLDGYAQTLDRRGGRALVLHDGGWAGHFLCEVDAGGTARILCSAARTASARWLDDVHVMVSARDFTWVARLTERDFVVVAGVEGVSGSITCLPRGMIAIDDSVDGWRLLAFRDGLLRVEKGRVKVPADAAPVDRGLVADGDRVLAATRTGEGVLELVEWDRAAGWDAAGEWDKAAKKLAKGRDVISIAAVAPRAPTAPESGVRVFADGSRWRFDGERVEVEVAGGLRAITLAEPLSGPHLGELPERERKHRVDAMVHGALDAGAGVAWLMTGAGKLVRASVTTGDAEIVASLSRPDLYASEETRGVFPLPDGRVLVAGTGELVIVDPTGAAAPHVTHFGGERHVQGCSAALRVEGSLIAYVRLCPHATKNGLPASSLVLTEIRGWPVTWQSWEIPLFAPRLDLDGATLHVSDGARALSFDLQAALAWYRTEWTGRTDVPGLPPAAQKK